MNIFDIGLSEILFILLLALIIFGPKDLQKAGKNAGQFLNRVVRSDLWKTITQASRKLKTLPNELMREAGVEEIRKSIAPIQADIQELNALGRKPARVGQEAPSKEKPVEAAQPPAKRKSPDPAGGRSGKAGAAGTGKSKATAKTPAKAAGSAVKKSSRTPSK